MSTFQQMKTVELDAWIRTLGQDLRDNEQTYTTKKYSVVAELMKEAVREKLKRVRRSNRIRHYQAA
jgi:hypothetical protein|tara:strand:- start:1219 stop:1416 length:198 start_codon:yes stop_codon:yes gene_type:complete